MKIVFFGTPDFAVASLDALVESGEEVVAVVTAPDRPAGRGRKLKASAVKVYARSKGLKVLQPTNLKDETFLSELQALQADLFVVVAFRMLPKAVWDMPPQGTFNLHASLLPDYRGAAPINWVLVNGETETGVTTFFINDRIDTGALLLQEKAPIREDDTAGTLHDRLMGIGSELVVDTVRMIGHGTFEPKPQRTSGREKAAPKLTRENTKIDWGRPAVHIYNKVRGLSPYPGAWCFLDNAGEELTVKIYSLSIWPAEHGHAPGQLITAKTKISVAVPGGYADIGELQLPGKRKMTTAALLNGFKPAPDARFY